MVHSLDLRDCCVMEFYKCYIASNGLRAAPKVPRFVLQHLNGLVSSASLTRGVLDTLHSFRTLYIYMPGRLSLVCNDGAWPEAQQGCMRSYT
jgi:hypothetical protein